MNTSFGFGGNIVSEESEYVGRLEQLRGLEQKLEQEGLEALHSASIGGEIRETVQELFGDDSVSDLEATSEYLVEASGVLRGLAREVMPLDRDRSTQSEDGEQPEDEQLLIERLLEYRKFKELAEQLEQRRDEFAQTYPRGAVPEEELTEELQALEGVELTALIDAFEHVLERKADETTPRVVQRDSITVEECTTNLRQALVRAEGRAAFSSLFTGNSRLELVVTFLALLELMREGVVSIQQSEQFGEISVELAEGSK
jgi:segregation and condensation protein A